MGKLAGKIIRCSLSVWLTGLICVLPFLTLEGLRIIAGTPAAPAEIITRVVLTGSVLILAWVGSLQKNADNQWSLTPVSLGIIITGLLTGLIYLLWKATWAAWVFTALFFGGWLILSRWLLDYKSIVWRYIGCCSLMCVAGTVLVVVGQVEGRFSDEEFFVILQGLGLGVYGVALFLAGDRLHKQHKWGCPETSLIRLPPRKFMCVGMALLLVLTAWGAISAYQHSFYPLDAAGYPGIQEEHPFICEDMVQTNAGITGANVSRRMLDLVVVNPNKGLPEYGLLASRTDELTWREAFRESILSEARRSEFTGKDGSIKYWQHHAALRVYYYALMQEKYPDLFSSTEKQELTIWFAEINQRVLTPGWVDWLYAVAYSKGPSGPYENQDHGAALLTLLEDTGLAPDNLSGRNRAYLDAQAHGWQRAFRVTDDVYGYQSEWIQNAWLQSRQDGIDLTNAQLSFEWLLWQALPDGGWPGYNMPYEGNLVASAYLGAVLLQDGRMLWLADRALTNLEEENGNLYAQPGMEIPLALEAISPDKGSCVLYGNSGLPNQSGPLAPDKIILRDGWDEEDRALLVNLRFTGWHRYKATNSVILYYQGESLIQEKTTGSIFSWLPEGRSLFRDKRILRENLNGLVVTRTGFSRVLSALTGFGGRWAQDPPYYATVEQFTTTDSMDQVTTRMDDWQGWDSWRQVTLYQSGPVVILDQAIGPQNGGAALVWQVKAQNTVLPERFMLRSDAEPVEMVLVPFGRWDETGAIRQQSEADNLFSTVFVETKQGELCLVTIILSGSWVGAEIHTVLTESEPVLEMHNAEDVIVQQLSFDCAEGEP